MISTGEMRPLRHGGITLVEFDLARQANPGEVQFLQ